MDAAATLRDARRRAGLTQAALAARAGTSQATISAYERGSKEPSLSTFERLLAAVGARLAVEEAQAPVVVPSAARLARSGRILEDVLALDEALPVRHDRELRFPRLPTSG
ncbi:MAG: helix-turn-helix domain-containing protein [Actinomycetota bacterium]|nr:helix-turn-helix domain-containing protein [Actinomycetota bacterium]